MVAGGRFKYGCRWQGGPTLEPNATLNEDLARTESLSSRPDGAPRSDLDDVGPAESHVARRAPSLQRSSYVSGSGQGRDRGLLMLHEVRLRRSSSHWLDSAQTSASGCVEHPPDPASEPASYGVDSLTVEP